MPMAAKLLVFEAMPRRQRWIRVIAAARCSTGMHQRRRC